MTLSLKSRVIISIIIVSAVIAVATVQVCAMEGYAAKPRFCHTSNELVNYFLEQAGNREQYISVAIPDDLPEAGMTEAALLTYILRKDSGFVRWGCKSVGPVLKTKESGYTAFYYTMQYYTTKEQDDAAKAYASAIAEKLAVEGLSGNQKMDRLKNFITANWRYDSSHKNVTAYSTMTSGKGTCLGLVIASKLILEEMGIPSQTIHGEVEGVEGHHIMLLVKADGIWYTFDPTELARPKPMTSYYMKKRIGAGFTPCAEYYMV